MVRLGRRCLLSPRKRIEFGLDLLQQHREHGIANLLDAVGELWNLAQQHGKGSLFFARHNEPRNMAYEMY